MRETVIVGDEIVCLSAAETPSNDLQALMSRMRVALSEALRRQARRA